MDISFIIINYRSREFLGRCIESIFKYAKPSSFEIIVINNDEQPLAKLGLDSVQIIECNANKGFSWSANRGAKKAIGKVLFFLNVDTEVLDLNIQDIFNTFNDPSVGAAAPRLLLPDGSCQPWSAGYEITFLDTIKNNLGHIRSKDIWFQNKTGTIDWASGAALAVSREVFEKCNGFDERFFMYFEDVDLCKRIRKIGKRIILLPHIRVLHIGGQSKLSTKEQKEQYYRSQYYYFKKHFGLISAYMISFLRNIVLFFSK